MRNPCNDREILHIPEEELLKIADRIDREHERMWRELTIDAEPVTDESMAEHGWVKLPVDADGVPIHVGDVMEWPTTGETFEVVGIGDGTVFYVDGGCDECADWTGASTKRHHHAPTVEDVLREFAEGLGVPVVDSYIAACAAKLRLAGDE